MSEIEVLFLEDCRIKKAAGRGGYCNLGRRGSKSISRVILPHELTDRRRDPSYRAGRCKTYCLHDPCFDSMAQRYSRITGIPLSMLQKDGEI